jgi:hypothetical protein
VLGEYHTQKQALSRFFLGAVILSDPVVEVIRRELRRVSPDVKIELDQIRSALAAEVLKREVMEGEKAEEARKKVAKSARIALKTAAIKSAAARVPTSVAAHAVAAPTEDGPPASDGYGSREPVSIPEDEDDSVPAAESEHAASEECD